LIPEPLPLTERAICYNGGIKDGCGATVEFIDGIALCPKCGIYQRYVKASAEFIQSVMGCAANVVSFAARA
jgi:hypothetical protein